MTRLLWIGVALAWALSGCNTSGNPGGTGEIPPQRLLNGMLPEQFYGQFLEPLQAQGATGTDSYLASALVPIQARGDSILAAMVRLKLLPEGGYILHYEEILQTPAR